MIETVVFAETADARFEADLEDGVAYVTVRVVNGSDTVFHAELTEDTGRVVSLDADPGQTVVVHPVPPVFRIDDLQTPASKTFGAKTWP